MFESVAPSSGRSGSGLMGLLLSAVFALSACDSCNPTVSTDAGPGPDGAVENDAVRSCEALYRLEGEEVPRVRFSSAVVGQSIPRAPRLALAFTAADDRSLVGEELFVFSFSREDQPDPVLLEARCYDADGALLDDDVLGVPAS